MAFADEVINDGSNAGINAAGISSSEPDSVSYQSSAIKAWLDTSLLPRTLLGGTRAMKLASNAFLFPHALESAGGYTRRLRSSTLLNAYRKTVSFLSGQVFQADIVFDEETDDVFEEWAEEIDAAGNNINVFAKRVFFNGLGTGVTHILIDMPPKDPDVVTKADEKEAAARPFFKEIKGEDILGGLVDENGFPIQVRIAESVTKRVGKYGSKTFARVRVLEPGTWELHEEADDGKSLELIDSGTFSVDVIPFVTFIPGEETTVLTGESPLMDLADLNAKHWRSSSDQDNYLSYCRFPLYFGKKLGDLAVLPMGRSLINSDDDNADLKTVEMNGSSIDAGRLDLKETEAQMALYGLQQLVPRTGNMTATEKALTSAESSSSLGTWATEFQAVLNKAFEIAGLFMGIEWMDNGLAVNHEFQFGIADPEMLRVILESYEKGILSAQACFSEFRRRGVFEEHLSWDDMEADLEQEKRDSIEMARLSGAAFGDAPGDDQQAEGDEDGEKDDKDKDE